MVDKQDVVECTSVTVPPTGTPDTAEFYHLVLAEAVPASTLAHRPIPSGRGLSAVVR